MGTNFEDITFDSRTHTYRYGTKSLMPVTSVIKWFTPEFKAEEILAAKAYETKRSVEDIKAEWDAKRDFGLDRGTRVHTYIENVMDGQDITLSKAMNEHIHEMSQFDIAWGKLRKTFDVELFKKEWTIGDSELGVAGRCDAILKMKSDSGDRLSLFDWKTGKFRSRKYAQESMLPPFDDLPNCEEVKYSMQLSLYRLIIGRNTDIHIDGGFILHLPDDGNYQLYNTIDLRDRMESWLIESIKEGKFGDPEVEKRASKLSYNLDSLDIKSIKMMSPNMRDSLLRKMRKFISTAGPQHIRPIPIPDEI